MAVPTPTKPEQDMLRGGLKNCPQSVWGKSFASLCPLDSELETHNKQVEEMKVKVKDIFLDSTKELADHIHFINLLCRLGVSYHFEPEINEQLGHILAMLPKLIEDNVYDLCTLANLFRILRQYGYNMTSDVFKKFIDGNGEFTREIANDVEGMLCLYEACFLAIPGEVILDEALSFTRKQLQILAENSSPSLQKHIKNALMFPSHRTPERLDALHYISFYEEREHVNETLVKFAKMDYNGLQLLYRKELAILSEWWDNINAAENFPYVRNRLAEAHMWAVGSSYEPQYSLFRIILCKYILIATVMDDTYDSYGTIDELQVFTAALQRFTADAGSELPEYMKYIYKFIFEETDDNGTEVCSCKNTYLKEMIKELARCYMLGENWKIGGKAPSFNDYLKAGKVTSTYEIFLSAFVLQMENIGMREIFWIRNDPPSATGAKLICRLMNDIAVRTNETKRGDFPKALDCYTKQYGVTEDEAYIAIVKLIENFWKGMNEDLVNPTNTMPRVLINYNFNYARLSALYYGGTDLYTYASNMKQLISSMFIDPLPI